MVVTSLKKSKKGNILIYADNNYLASIKLEVFLQSKIKIGGYIDEEILENLKENENLSKAKEKAFRLLSLRAHSKKELEYKIKRSLGEKCAESATEKMESIGLVNDKEFAIMYAKELFSRKLYSIKRVKYELFKKGISADIIESVLNEIDIDERENIEKILKKKHFNKDAVSAEKELKKIISYCQRLGYSWSDIKSVINIYDYE